MPLGVSLAPGRMAKLLLSFLGFAQLSVRHVLKNRLEDRRVEICLGKRRTHLPITLHGIEPWLHGSEGHVLTSHLIENERDGITSFESLSQTHMQNSTNTQ